MEDVTNQNTSITDDEPITDDTSSVPTNNATLKFDDDGNIYVTQEEYDNVQGLKQNLVQTMHDLILKESEIINAQEEEALRASMGIKDFSRYIDNVDIKNMDELEEAIKAMKEHLNTGRELIQMMDVMHSIPDIDTEPKKPSKKKIRKDARKAKVKGVTVEELNRKYERDSKVVDPITGSLVLKKEAEMSEQLIKLENDISNLEKIIQIYRKKEDTYKKYKRLLALRYIAIWYHEALKEMNT